MSRIIISDQNLSEYFYGHLSDVNKNFDCPLPQEMILYSSEVMQRFAVSENFFGEQGEKILGIQYLKAEQKSVSERKEIYKEIGDQVLFQLGVFPERINKKSPSKSYYINIGKSAYSKVAALDCTFYDIPNFYNYLATSLENLIKVLTHAALKLNYSSLEQYLLENPGIFSEFKLGNKAS